MRETDTRTEPGHVVVIGGGIAGLAAAHHLLQRGARVTVLEASDRLGGKLHAGEITGVRVDLGAESMLARRPEAVALAREVGLGERLQAPATASASLWTRGALRPMPKGHVMGVPADADSLAGVVSEEGLARIARESELPPTEVGEDIAVGEYVAARVGREVVDRLVEPLLGGVYAGDSYRLSLRMAVPQLYEVARAGGSLLDGVRELQERAAARQAAGPVFMGIEGGVGQLPLAVAESVRARGGEIRTGTPVTGLSRDGGWTVRTAEGTVQADAVVVALPAPQAARLLDTLAPAAATELRTVEYASMALTAHVFRRDETDLPPGSGFLVPPVDGQRIKAATFASQKWQWIADEDPELVVVRTSVGRYGETEILEREDGEIVEISREDLKSALGVTAEPVASRVIRWNNGLPQYPVGHQAKVARIREHLAHLEGLAVCGAAYDGVGIPAVIASARAAADQVLQGTGQLSVNPGETMFGGAGQ
ncbi:protoporphyrinogen oxidase [Streptomyces sp. TRM66268-LWL]|uniref:Coproporphyrinogen III oxidase n=1 Tax=Streptomyces polyasparticus TaxID=2767826 RepID=A0ABR7SD53_9ACTN|nr:protoporphyrinogen oxidase [Streptomyces polyasparticus]MBC9713104.1 protoporphyrinogen oxidase [Streptomyces polyasparticus]